MFTDLDRKYMLRALALAERGLYTTTPNPRVGCVLVRDGEVIGEGSTQLAGQSHAEVEALNDARARGMTARGASAYVTLEPCSHFGRTPPCVNALLKSGIMRVIAAMEDPNPLVSGKGFESLRKAGVEVRCGLLEHEARELNLGFISRMTRARPWVRAKIAASLDGATALHDGKSQWITGTAARIDGHAWRARACAVMTGIGTARLDNPRLTVREVQTPRQPLRILLDSNLEVDLESNLVKIGNLLIVCARRDPFKEQELIDRGCDLLHLPNLHGRVDLGLLMHKLGERGINELHVEAGSRLNGALLRDGCIDELLIYLAPSLLGTGRAMFDLPLLGDLGERWPLRFHDTSKVGDDLRILARFAVDASAGETPPDSSLPVHSVAEEDAERP